MKTFSEVLKALDEKTNGGAKKNTAFSRKDFSDLTCALINDNEYEAEGVKTKGGEPVEVKTKPVEDFRKAFIEKVLVDHGVDKHEASKAATTYEFTHKQADTLYPILTESLTQYMGVGRTFTFPSKKDLVAALKIRHIDEHEMEYKNRETGVVTRSHVEAHRQMVKKSSAPKWCKTKID